MRGAVCRVDPRWVEYRDGVRASDGVCDSR